MGQKGSRNKHFRGKSILEEEEKRKRKEKGEYIQGPLTIVNKENRFHDDPEYHGSEADKCKEFLEAPPEKLGKVRIEPNGSM